jgi:hypothetical protein
MHIVIHYKPLLTRLLVLGGGALVLTLFLYGALLLGAVMHTAAQTKLEREVAALDAHISEGEVAYFAALRAITPELAQEKGFVAPSYTTTIFAHATGDSLTLRER